jgi:ABC-type microcin C transport system permease subunit YejE
LLRLSGFLLLVLAFIVAASRLGWAYGAVVWFGWLTISAGLIVSAQTYRMRTVSQVRR